MTFEQLKNTQPWEWPQGADKTILNILNNPSSSPKDRELAAEMAGDSAVINAPLIEALQEIINSPTETEDLRSASTMALGPVLELLDMGDLTDQPDLHACALNIPETLRRLHLNPNEPTFLRRRALETSVRLEQDWHRDAIITALSSTQAAWHRTAVFAMRFVSGFEQQIIEALKNDDADTEFQAVCAADVWQIESAWDHVLKLAQNSETEKVLRMASLEALASIRPEAAAEVIENLDIENDDELKDRVQEILRMIDGD